MSGYSDEGSQPSLLVGPNQAAQVFGGSGWTPRQKHMFLVRFTPYVTFRPESLTFVIKHCERPKVSVKTEELNQYNKKRHIYTGFKYEPLRMTFYDSAGGAAQNMWTAYARYYFGDFQPLGEFGYGYDITTNQWLPGSGYGLTENYGGDTTHTGQWFFHNISIYHFYDRLFDQYTLINPRIQSYEPDELDYEESKVSQVNMSFVYENLQYNPGQTVTNDLFPEFGSLFKSGGFAVPPTGNPPPLTSSVQTITPVNPPVNSLLANVTSSTPGAAPYRATDDITSNGSSALNSYGDFSFGTYTPTSSMDASNGMSSFAIPSATTGAPAASTSVLSNQYGLSDGSAPTPLSFSIPAATTGGGANGVQIDISSANNASVLSSQYGSMDSTLNAASAVTGAPATSEMTAAQMYGTSSAPAMTANQMYGGSTAPTATAAATPATTGVTPTPAALTMMNTQQTGTAQYGVNITELY